MSEGRNRLGEETSPYLLQHAHNPVHWWAWGEEVIAEAKRTNRPILLSVGYAACHWCHVMAHESFESPDVAAVMNELFVNIKVDREERPDVDGIYMQALHLLGEHGGWPLTMFCTPDGEPFWGGTYFPYPARFGRPSFVDVLRGVAQAWRDKPQDIETNRSGLLKALRKSAANKAVVPKGDGPLIPIGLLDQIAERLADACDPVWGGFGQAPKFPSPYVFENIWRGWLRGRANAKLFDAVTVTLDRMCQGGIYDHLGGGFARYATDAQWLIPHFEKMLYDNAQLIDLLTLVWQETKSPLYATRIAETCDWVLREMIAEGGGFAATYDADSEGVEGKFYVWDASEIDAVLGTEDGAFFRASYDVTPEGNWEHHNILHRNRAPALLGEAEEQRLATLRTKLKAVRDKRVWPGWDDKVLADWNGLMIAALANASAVFQRDDWLTAAVRAWRFVMDTMRDGDGRLFHSHRAGKRLHRGTLDDYANMARAGIALFEATGETRYLEEAKALVAVLDKHFTDPSSGGYFITADDAADLIVRAKNCHDNAVPSGNGTLVGVFARLWILTGEAAWRDKADMQVAAFAGELEGNFFPLMTLLNGYETLQSAVELVIVGNPSRDETESLRRAVYAKSLPNKIVRRLAPDALLPPDHPAAGKGLVGGRPALYVCRNQTCQPPVTDPTAVQLN
ncbi:MAG: thioredoxin domain-containing protein [Proteobacteria bacterium]|nr:thioredoxin domain-containing protein [Pseudomonadota bacterium]